MLGIHNCQFSRHIMIYKTYYAQCNGNGNLCIIWDIIWVSAFFVKEWKVLDARRYPMYTHKLIWTCVGHLFHHIMFHKQQDWFMMWVYNKDRCILEHYDQILKKMYIRLIEYLLVMYINGTRGKVEMCTSNSDSHCPQTLMIMGQFSAH